MRRSLCTEPELEDFDGGRFFALALEGEREPDGELLFFTCDLERCCPLLLEAEHDLFFAADLERCCLLLLEAERDLFLAEGDR